MRTGRPRIVVVGGGTGCPTTLRGLKAYPADLTAIVTTMDSGGSSGVLRREFGVPALGDVRRALGALADESDASTLDASLLEHRFPRDSSLAGHTLGNLLLLALMEQQKGLGEGISTMAALLGATGRVVPATLGMADLHARLEDGTVLEGEAAIDQRGPSPIRIGRIWLSPAVPANPQAVSAIGEADAIVFGPGDLYTSVLPNLLVEGMAAAVQHSAAKKLFIGNLATKPGETEGFRLSDFLRAVIQHAGLAGPLDAVVLDNGDVPGAVEQDLGACQGLARHFVHRPLARRDNPSLHDAKETAAAVLGALSLAV